VIRALKQAGVPVAGADVMRLAGELAVKDLLAALRIAATTRDDLSLAAVLRSPLGGITEDELFALAHGRRGRLWAELRGREGAPWGTARAMVSDLLGQADYLRPYELLQRILVRHDGRRRLVARLGEEAEDGIDGLLEQALAYERSEAPSLTGFLAWIDRDDVDVKRRAETAADQVRVMTVHGAKGLEAPIVILPDTVDRHEGQNAPQILRIDGWHAVWHMSRASAPEAFRAAEEHRRALARAENMRLLYVAMTRAETWLIVCGAGQEPKPGGGSWYALVAAAMDALGPERVAGPDGETRVLAHRWSEARAAPPPAPGSADGGLPAWAAAPAPRRAAGARLVSPSQLGGAHALAPDGGVLTEPDADAMARGEAIHLLLELLHGRLEADWPALAARALPRRADAAGLLAEAAAVLRAPGLGFVFAPGTLAEVAVTAPLAELCGGRIEGRIDRLVIAPDRVLAVDFKSNRVVPASAETIPDGLLRQLGAYRAALAQIWPGRTIETAIVWTRTATLMPVPHRLTSAALAKAGHLDRPGAAP
jgi:ATP-dependent helicase/nuclease subunit A